MKEEFNPKGLEGLDIVAWMAPEGSGGGVITAVTKAYAEGSANEYLKKDRADYTEPLVRLSDVAALAPQGEVVAWTRSDTPTVFITALDKTEGEKYNWDRVKLYTVPLYASPVAPVAPEALELLALEREAWGTLKHVETMAQAGDGAAASALIRIYQRALRSSGGGK